MIAGGVESMTRAPYVMPKADKAYDRNPKMFDTTLGWRMINPNMPAEYTVSMGETAENVARSTASHAKSKTPSRSPRSRRSRPQLNAARSRLRS